MKIEDLNNIGTITNTYGVYIGNLTSGTQTNTPFSIYASDTNALNYFGGRVGVGTSTPQAKLDVVGDINVSGSVNGIAIYRNGDWNLALGGGALSSNTSGVANLAIGYGVLQQNTNGEGNTAVGASAVSGPATLGSNVTGKFNTAFGYNALKGNTGGYHNVGVGDEAGSQITTGSSNIAIGPNAQVPSPTADSQLSIGNWIYGVEGKIGIGTTAPAAKLDVAGNASISGNLTVGGTFTAANFASTGLTGGSAGLTLSAGGTNQNVTVTPSGTGYTLLNGNVGISTTTPVAKLDVAGYINTDASSGFQQAGTTILRSTGNSVFAGPSAGNLTASGTDNSAVGPSALAAVTTGSYNTALGSNALKANTSGAQNSAFGYNALAANTVGARNMAFGQGALAANTSGSDNVAIGSRALQTNTAGSNNIAIGKSAGVGSTGGNNVFIGFGAGSNVTTGSNNIAIGYNVSTPSATDSNQLTIGNLIFGTSVDGTGTTISSGNVGIGTSTPAAKLEIQGSSALQSNALAVQLGVYDNGAMAAGVGGIIAFGGHNNTSNSDYQTFGAIKGAKENGTSGSDDGYLSFFTRITGSALTAEKMRISSGGNVGIGTATPAAKLDVVGNAAISGDLTLGGTFTAANFASTGLTGGSTGLALSAGGTNQNVTITPSGTGYTLLNGNVGIGTASPSAPLTVGQTGSVDNGTFQVYKSPAPYNFSFGGSMNSQALIQTTTNDFTTTSGQRAGLLVSHEVTRFGPLVTGIYSEIHDPFNYTGAVGVMRGSAGVAAHYGTGNASMMVGHLALASNYSNADNVVGIRASTSNGTTPGGVTSASAGNVVAVDALFSNLGTTSTVQTYTGLHVGDVANQGMLTNTYGVYIGNLTAGTQTNKPFSFYASDANSLNYFAGDMGIGTANPQSKLHVFNNNTFSALRLQNDNGGGSTANYVVQTDSLALGNNGFGIYDAAQSTYRFVINGSGNVGIGTSTPTAKLDLVGNANVSGNLTAGGTVSAANYSTFNNNTFSALHLQNNNGSGSSASYSVQTDSLVLGNNGFGIYDLAQSSYRLAINGAGNVGIGTTTPTAKLDVAGNAAISGSLTVGGTFTAANFASTGLTGGNTGLALSAGGTNQNVTITPSGTGSTIINGNATVQNSLTVTGNITGAATGLALAAGGTNQNVTITPSGTGVTVLNGNVGVGINAPAAKMHVADLSGFPLYLDEYNDSPVGAVVRGRKARGTVAAPRRVFNGDALTGLNAFGAFAPDDASDAIFPPVASGMLRFHAAENFTDAARGTYLTLSTTPIGSTTWAEQLRVTDSGNVGIGTSTPATKLDVAGNASISGNLSVGGTFTAANFGGGAVTGGSSGLALNAGGTNQSITLTPSGTGATVINGNVGVGTTSPSAKLDVAGVVRNQGVQITTLANATILGTDASGNLVAASAASLAPTSSQVTTALGYTPTNKAGDTLTGNLKLAAGTATVAPLTLQSGTSLTTPVFGAVEFDGTAVYVTNNVASPTRKTLAYSATNLAGYGITDPVVLTSGSYTDPAWIASLTAAKLTGTLTAAVMPALTGDVTSSAGSTTLMLANTGVTAGTYAKVTVDAKGRVTSGATLGSSDVTGALGYTPYNATNPSGYITASGAPVQSVFGRTGAVTLTAADLTSALTFTPVNKAGDAFTGSVTLVAGGTSAAPLIFQSGSPLTTPSFGAVEFDGTNLYLTNNASSPTRKTLAFAATTLSGYGITDPVVLTNGSYADPVWVTSLAASKLSGALAAGAMPAFSGDVTSSAGSTTLTLANSGVTAGTYAKVTVDVKGRVTSGAALGSSDVAGALGYTPYNATNPSGYITASGAPVQSVFGRTGSVTLASGDVTGALGYTPYDASNPAGYLTTASIPVQSVFGRTGNVTLTSSDVTTALGFTPLSSASGAFSGAVTAATLTATNGTISGGSAGLAVNAGGTNQNVTIAPSGTGATIINGNVGIGATDPSATLDVRRSGLSGSGANTIMRLDARGTAGGAGFGGSLDFISSNEVSQHGFTAASIASYWEAGDNLFGLRFLTKNAGAAGGATTEKMRITSAGNVGIGTLTPDGKLTVTQSGNGALNSIIAEDNARRIKIGRDQIQVTDLLNGAQQLYLNPTGGLSLATTSGNVGIGTTAPAVKLDVVGSAAISGNLTVSGTFSAPGYTASSGTVTGGTTGLALNAGGTNQSVIITPSGTGATVLNGNVGVGTNSPTVAKLQIESTGTGLQVKGGDLGAGTIIANFVGSDNASKLYIRGDGNVGVGTTNPGTYKLAVNGTIHTKEVVVDQTGWADDVFNANYRNAPLNEVEQHIKEHGHLPGVPSAQEVAEKGVSVGEMQATLLRKIEELTLHQIEQQKQIRQLGAQVEKLQSENDALRSSK